MTYKPYGATRQEENQIQQETKCMLLLTVAPFPV